MIENLGLDKSSMVSLYGPQIQVIDNKQCKSNEKLIDEDTLVRPSMDALSAYDPMAAAGTTSAAHKRKRELDEDEDENNTSHNNNEDEDAFEQLDDEEYIDEENYDSADMYNEENYADDHDDHEIEHDDDGLEIDQDVANVY